MNIWLDDKRPMPPGFDVHCLNAHHAAKLIRCGLVDMISLDHDLGEEALFGTGYTVALEIEALAQKGGPSRRLSVYLHTQNPVGRSRMQSALRSAMLKSDRVTLMSALDTPVFCDLCGAPSGQLDTEGLARIAVWWCEKCEDGRKQKQLLESG